MDGRKRLPSSPLENERKRPRLSKEAEIQKLVNELQEKMVSVSEMTPELNALCLYVAGKIHEHFSSST